MGLPFAEGRGSVIDKVAKAPVMRCIPLSGEALFAMPGLGKSLHPGWGFSC